MVSVYQNVTRDRSKLKHASVKISAFISARSFTYELNYLWICIFIQDTRWPVLHFIILLQKVNMLNKNMSKVHDKIWTIASKTKIANLGMISQIWFIIVEILSKWSSNFAALVTWLKQSSRNKPNFFHAKELYISWIKFVKQALNRIYSKLALNFLKLICQ